MSIDIERFIYAQKEKYEDAYKEIESGKKVGHWIWYIFPQFIGIGFSYESYHYGITSLSEAREYYNNDYLRSNLLKITETLLNLNTIDINGVVGSIDYAKIRSSMTLFYLISNNELFKKVIDKYYNSEFDKITLEIINVFGEKEISGFDNYEIIHNIVDKYR